MVRSVVPTAIQITFLLMHSFWCWFLWLHLGLRHATPALVIFLWKHTPSCLTDCLFQTIKKINKWERQKHWYDSYCTFATHPRISLHLSKHSKQPFHNRAAVKDQAGHSCLKFLTQRAEDKTTASCVHENRASLAGATRHSCPNRLIFISQRWWALRSDWSEGDSFSLTAQL